ncbi:hypothetical protein G4V39_07085 [Thermosulfuriphilus ammonigenes]|uniref:Uncharacterized protein n=1 Tax=Thermosulfuriphilus ammonigenes TaxID=1936021 RepID=A0A6G7PWK8_9BACT|nr:hypothetical protein [Thermosulfuriphilus ammonigenes]MBA2847753.1 hypothetical protein [Thermosulfuriphilus ammonigenes]QIJ72042.1 hypothetical protein G4V39_07085 [Thermosulfuriphilus ammonigenes]
MNYKIWLITLMFYSLVSPVGLVQGVQVQDGDRPIKILFGRVPKADKRQVYALVEKQILKGGHLKGVVLKIGAQTLTIPVSPKVELFRVSGVGETAQMKAASWSDLTPGTLLQVYYLPEKGGRIESICIIGHHEQRGKTGPWQRHLR